MSVRRRTAEEFRRRVNRGLPAELLRSQPGAVRGSIWTLAAEALEQLAQPHAPARARALARSQQITPAGHALQLRAATTAPGPAAAQPWDGARHMVAIKTLTPYGEANKDNLRRIVEAFRPLRVYVAGGSSEAVMVRGYMVRLKRSGVEITYDWTADVIRWRGAGCPPLTAEQRAAHARADLDGIERADLVWWILPAALSEGSAFEAGVAHGLALALARLGQAGPRLVVSGDRAAHGRVFPELAAERWESHDAALAAIVSLAAAHRDGDQSPTS